MNCTTNRVTKASALELLIGREARPFGLLPVDVEESVVDREQMRAQAKENMQKNAQYDKQRFDKNKAKVVRYKVGDHVLLNSEERHQTKLDPKFKGPFQVINVLDGDRYELKSLVNKRTYKYSHEWLRALPDRRLTAECNGDSQEGKDMKDGTSDRASVSQEGKDLVNGTNEVACVQKE